MDDVTDLIARLESAAEGSRELDRDVAEAVGWERKALAMDSDDYWRTGDMSWTREDHEHPPQFTTSLDAALTLVPEGSEWEISTLYAIARSAVGLNDGAGPWHGEHTGCLPALALCAAALGAIQHG